MKARFQISVDLPRGCSADLVKQCIWGAIRDLRDKATPAKCVECLGAVEIEVLGAPPEEDRKP
jgi:hypothetical protein